MAEKFKKMNKVLQIILLLIPFVNWIVEIIIRWEVAIKKGKVSNIIMAVLVTLFGLFFILEIIDIISICLTGHLFVCDY